MAIVESFQRRGPPAVVADQGDTYRLPPHNVEAEQALLGAILINNDAFDRVSDFLQAAHFSEEIHRRIYDLASQLIRSGKLATPITLKTFLSGDDLGGITVPAVSRPPRRGGHHHHQRGRLRPCRAMTSRCGAASSPSARRW